MSGRTKKILATAAVALMAMTLPTGCAIEILPGIIGGGATSSTGPVAQAL